MKDPKGELAALSAEVRRRVQREQARGRSHLLSPGLSQSLKGGTPPAARAAKPGAGTVAKPASAKPAPAKPAAAKPASAKPASAKPASAKPAGKPAPKPAGEPPASVTGGDRGKKLSVIAVEPATPEYDRSMKELAKIAKKASACTTCGLCETRTHVVFSRGSARNRVMFVGEAPGANEDKQGEPFVGRAGQLLDQIIDAVGFQRDEIYITNILKCRPPQNRDPKPEEIAACTPYLEQQIELIQPKIICALGRFAAQFLTGKPDASMGQLRGRIDTSRDRIMVLPTYHPAALLRNPNFKRVVWEDVQLLRKEYLR